MPGYVTLVSSIYEHMCKLHVDRPRPLLMWCLSNSVGFRAADMPGGAHRMKEVTCQTQHANMPEKPPPPPPQHGELQCQSYTKKKATKEHSRNQDPKSRVNLGDAA